MARILVADDEASVREFIARALEAEGHALTLAADGAEALARLQTGPFDLLLADIRMPVMDGIALALKAASEYPQLRILLMTGFSEERERAHNLEKLVHAVLVKPFDLAALRRAVNDALA
jgi:CheY-like chemotaxis protein